MPTFTQIKTTIANPLLPWQYMLLGLAVFLLLAYQVWILRERITWGYFWGITAIRFGIFVLLILFLLNPTLLFQKLQKIPMPFAVLVDNSPSMSLADNPVEQESRLDKVKQMLLSHKADLWQQLSTEYDVRLYTVNEEVQPVAFEELEQLEVTGKGSALLEALLAVQNEYRDLPLAGILLFTDGANNLGLEDTTLLENFPLPVFPVEAGNTAVYKDLQIVENRMVNFAFLRSPVTVDLTLKSWGYQDMAVPVVLKQDNQIIATTLVQITQKEFTHPVSFTFTPREVGTFHYTVETPLQIGEAIRTNNRKDFSLQVVRDKIRILVVSGRPSWSYRFLRRALKSDPTIDLISFIILRTPSDVVNVSERQLSLIPFPTNRLFTQELENFDLLIFDNFSYVFYFPLLYLENVKRFVAEGGAFAMFGGSESFSEGGYANTPLEEILPVDLSDRSRGYVFQPGQVELTKEGETHPITQISSDREETKLLWEEMPELEGFNRTLRVKPDATVLESYVISGTNQRFPLLATMKYKKGRTLALLTDQSWRWNFEMVGQNKGNRYYLRFIKQMIRWLIKDPNFKQVQVLATKETYQPDEEVELRIRVYDDDFSPATDAILTLTSKNTTGEKVELPYAPTSYPGEYLATYQPASEGFFTVEVEAQRQGKILGNDETLFRVAQLQREFENAAPDDRFLRKIADLTGGKFFPLTTTSPDLVTEIGRVLEGKAQYKIIEERPLEIRNTWWAFLVLVGLFSLEWILRRRSGLI